MVTIGENLQYERYDVIEVDNTIIKLKGRSTKTETMLISEIKALELTGSKSNSEFSGTMEWGMRNPTFILPTTIWNNIISLFKRRSDTLYYKATMSDDSKIIICSSSSEFNQKLKQIAQNKEVR